VYAFRDKRLSLLFEADEERLSLLLVTRLSLLPAVNLSGLPETRVIN
jgi:hypothetical protein